MKLPRMIFSDKYETINPDSVKLFDYRNTDWYRGYPSLFHLKADNSHFWEIGQHYILDVPACEGFEMPKSEYEFKAIINEYSGVTIDSVVMKKISGTSSFQFTLSKNDCKACGIEYEPHLELLPKSLRWVKVHAIEREFNENDFSTTPVNPDTGFIHAFAIKLDGFEQTRYQEYVYSRQFESMAYLHNLLDNIKIIAKREVRNAEDTMTIWHPNDIINDISHVFYKFTKDGLFLIVDITPGTDICELSPDMFQNVSINDILEIKVPANIFTPLSRFQEFQECKKENKARETANQLLKKQLFDMMGSYLDAETYVEW